MTPPSAEAPGPRIAILGGGFGGLFAARALRGAPVAVDLIDRRNFHLFQPLLYQVATGGLSPANIATPLRTILKRQRNLKVHMADVADVDLAGRTLLLRGGGRLPYDAAIIAAGSRHQYFGHDAWQALAPGLKSLEEATEMRRRILSAFELAEMEADPAVIGALMTFVIVGAGATGVELAGALAEIARHTLRHEFRTIDPRASRILLVEGADRVLPGLPPRLSRSAEASLRKLGVTVLTGTTVTSISPDSVSLRSGQDEQALPARTVLWAAGIQASPLAASLARQCGRDLEGGGRIAVEPDLSLPGHPEVFVVGDMAHFAHGLDRPLPAMAPIAMQQGRYAARVILARLRGSPPPGPFRYHDKGTMATIGRAAAVANIAGLQISGLPAWLAWLFVHLMYLVGFANRLLVLLQWSIRYVTWNRSARLITRSAPDDD